LKKWRHYLIPRVYFVYWQSYFAIYN
jgi:hypothetical protein